MQHWFIHTDYLAYQAKKQNCSLHTFSSTDRTLKLTLAKEGNLFKTPLMAPYGGFEVVKETNPNTLQANIAQLHDLVISLIPAQNYWLIRSAPEFTNTLLFNELNNFFNTRQIKPAFFDFTFAIKLSQSNLGYPSSQLLNLHRGEKHKLNKAQKAKFICKELPISMLHTAYAVLWQNRQSKGYPVTISLPDLNQLFINFSANYKLFGVYAQANLIAIAVVVVVAPTIWYTLYLAHLPSYSSFSPVVFLVHELAHMAHQNGATHLDLGTASQQGRVNQGLTQFKKNLGAQGYPLYTYKMEGQKPV